MTITDIVVHGLSPDDVRVSHQAPPRPFVQLAIGDVSYVIRDTAVLDAPHEAITKAFELLAPPTVECGRCEGGGADLTEEGYPPCPNCSATGRIPALVSA